MIKNKIFFPKKSQEHILFLWKLNKKITLEVLVESEKKLNNIFISVREDGLEILIHVLISYEMVKRKNFFT